MESLQDARAALRARDRLDYEEVVQDWRGRDMVNSPRSARSLRRWQTTRGMRDMLK